MLSLNQYTSAQRKIYLDTISGRFGGYELKITVQVLTNRHKVVSTIRNVLMDGQVDAKMVAVENGDIEVSRELHLQFLDPAHTLAFDSSSASDGAVYLDRMLRVTASIRCSFGWVDVALFTGPITGVNRDADTVFVDAAGKETFGLRSAWYSYTYKKGYKTAVMRGLLTRSGESSKYMDLPTSKSKIAKAVVLARESKPWVKFVSLATSMSRYGLYDARGIARAPIRSTKPVISFTDGDGGLLITEPQVSFSDEKLKNAWIIVGGNPPGPKKHVSATVVAPKSHPLSPWTIGRDDKGRGGFLTGREDNLHIRSTSKAVARGKQNLDHSLLMGTDATWECLPVWHLDPWDVARISTSRFSGSVRVNSFSLPLRIEGEPPSPMTCGYTKNVTKPRRPRRVAQ